MFEIFKSVIESGNYELNDMLKKIDTIWIQGELTDEQKNTLATLARENANPENTYAPIQEQIDSLFQNFAGLTASVRDILNRVKVLEGGEPNPEPDPNEYPEYVQPSGAHDAYREGDKVTYNGKKYVCKMDGCVWNPDAYPVAWDEVKE